MIGAGDRFLDFTLADRAGKSYDTRTARADGPLFVAFFKISCSVCQLAFPYLQRVADAYPGMKIWGVSQNSADETLDFARQYGIRFPVLFDTDLSVTDAFDLVSVPSQYLVGADGVVQEFCGGWSKEFIDGVTRVAADASGVPFLSVIGPTDSVPDWKPG
jgi:peroxiredoxin